MWLELEYHFGAFQQSESSQPSQIGEISENVLTFLYLGRILVVYVKRYLHTDFEWNRPQQHREIEFLLQTYEFHVHMRISTMSDSAPMVNIFQNAFDQTGQVHYAHV